MILLYGANETQFTDNGIGVLADAVSCIVTEERNGAYELEMRYPINGVHYKDLQYRNIIFAKPNPFDEHQPFRIYRITRPLDGIVTVYAWHITYDLNGIPVKPFHTYTIEGTLAALRTNAAIENLFTYSTDKDEGMNGEVVVDVPLSARYILGGMEGSVLQTYRGEYKYDRFNVALLTNRGANHGVVLRYGKNIVRLEQDENFGNLYTGVAPYWRGDEESVYLPETIVFVTGTYDFERILALDLTERFETAPSEEDLRSEAERYIVDNNIGVPTASVTIDYAMDSEIESVHLCDTVGAIYTALGVQVSAKCVRTVFDALLDRYAEITLGQAKSNFAEAYAAQNQNLTKRIRRIESDYATSGEIRTITREEISNDTSILQQAEAIIASALEEYVRTSDYNTFRSTIQTNFSILAGEVEAGFQSTASDITNLSNNTEQSFASIYSFIRLLATKTDEHGTITQQGGIVIGESTNDIKLKLENDVLYFFTGDEKLVTPDNAIAWFASNQLYVNNTTINNLTLGSRDSYMDIRIIGENDNICMFFSGRLS